MSLIDRWEAERLPVRYDFRDPLDDASRALGGPLLRRLLETRAFRRLDGIRFLGAIDYVLVAHPNGAPRHVRYTRAQHSRGVARLALHHAALTGLAEADRRLVLAAALLHDIGHGPFSHSIEPVFRDLFGIDHHRATLRLVAGKTPLGAELAAVLREEKVDAGAVAAILSGEVDPTGGFFRGPINFDTLEGIIRSLHYLSATVTLDPLSVLRAAVERRDAADRSKVDLFWETKDEVYASLIKSGFGLEVDLTFQEVARGRAAALTPDDLLSSEPRFLARHPDFRDAVRRLRKGAALLPAAEIPFQKRRFRVDESGDFFARDDRARYRQFKIDDTFAPSRSGGDGPAAGGGGHERSDRAGEDLFGG